MGIKQDKARIAISTVVSLTVVKETTDTGNTLLLKPHIHKKERLTSQKRMPNKTSVK